MDWYRGILLSGYGMASGAMPNCPFPGGSLKYQFPIMQAHGIPVENLWPGTLNIRLSKAMPLRPGPWGSLTMHWYPGRKPTIVDMFPVLLELPDGRQVEGLNYGKKQPPKHLGRSHPPEVTEVLAPWIAGLKPRDILRLGVEPMDHGD